MTSHCPEFCNQHPPPKKSMHPGIWSACPWPQSSFCNMPQPMLDLCTLSFCTSTWLSTISALQQTELVHGFTGNPFPPSIPGSRAVARSRSRLTPCLNQPSFSFILFLSLPPNIPYIPPLSCNQEEHSFSSHARQELFYSPASPLWFCILSSSPHKFA